METILLRGVTQKIRGVKLQNSKKYIEKLSIKISHV